MSSFTKAVKTQAKARLCIQGPSGSGKTYSALAIASGLGKKIAVIDTEYGSASKYSDDFDFDTVSVKGSYHPDTFVALLREAEKSGYDVVVGDSLTHYWNGTGGFLELVDLEAKKTHNSFAAWKVVTPIYNNLVESILGSGVNVIVTLRAKQDYAQETDSNTGKKKVVKLGMAAEMRDNFQYEMDIEGMLDMEHNFIIGKTRMRSLDGRVIAKPGKELGEEISRWLSTGAVPPSPLQLIQSRLTEIGKTDADLLAALLAAGKAPEGTETLAGLGSEMLAKIEKNWAHALKLLK